MARLVGLRQKYIGIFTSYLYAIFDLASVEQPLDFSTKTSPKMVQI